MDVYIMASCKCSDTFKSSYYQCNTAFDFENIIKQLVFGDHTFTATFGQITILYETNDTGSRKYLKIETSKPYGLIRTMEFIDTLYCIRYMIDLFEKEKATEEEEEDYAMGGILLDDY